MKKLIYRFSIIFSLSALLLTNSNSYAVTILSGVFKQPQKTSDCPPNILQELNTYFNQVNSSAPASGTDITMPNWNQFLKTCSNAKIQITIAGEASWSTGGITIINTTLQQLAQATNTTNSSSVIFQEYIDFNGTVYYEGCSGGGGMSALMMGPSPNKLVLLGIGGGSGGGYGGTGAQGGGGGNDPGQQGGGGGGGDGGANGIGAYVGGQNIVVTSSGISGGGGGYTIDPPAGNCGGGGGNFGFGGGGGGGGYCNTSIGTCSASDWTNGGGNSNGGYIQIVAK